MLSTELRTQRNSPSITIRPIRFTDTDMEADEWQHKGIGTLLTEKLVEFAKGHGVKCLYSVDLADNTSMRQLAEEIGMNERRDPDDARQVIYSLTL
jgi:GNAT superfamily N-acetyltransferase